MIPGLEQGLLSAPFAICLAVMHRIFGRLDVAIDATVAAAGFSAWYVLAMTGQPVLAWVAAATAGAVTSVLSTALETRCGIDRMMAGLAMHITVFSVLALLVGESRTLFGLPPLLGIAHPGSNEWVALLLAISIVVVTAWLVVLASEVGLIGRVLEGRLAGPNLRTSAASVVERLSLVNGALVGLGAVLVTASTYTVSGLPTFGRFVDALVSALLAERIGSGLKRLAARRRGAGEVERGIGAIQLIWLTLAAAVALQMLIALVLRLAPNPSLPTLITSALLVIVLVEVRRHVPARGPPTGGDGLEIRDLTVSWGTGRGAGTVLQGLSTSWPRRGVVRLHGANGAGKSTLLKAISGGVTPESGAIYWGGHLLSGAPAWQRRVFHAPQPPRHSLGPSVSAWDNMIAAQIGRPSLFRFAESRSRRRRIRDWLDGAGLGRLLGDGRLVRSDRAETLSSGEMQALQLSMAELSQEVEIVLLDEPTTGLDDRVAVELLAQIRRLGDRCLVVVVSHDQRTCELGGEAWLLAGGKLIRGER